MRKRRSVDWEEEIRKTKRIQKKGFGLSLLSFIVAMGIIGGVKFYSPEAPVGKMVLPAISMALALLVVVWVFRRRRR